MLKFSCNISTLFKEKPFLERFGEAKNFGFKYVEIQNPFDYSASDLMKAKGDISVDLINAPTGTEYGFAAVPVKEGEFSRSMNNVLEYLYALNFKKVHILSGLSYPEHSQELQRTYFINNLNSLLEQDYLEDNGITTVIEPICEEVIPNYFLNSFELAVDILNEVKSPRVKLLLDIYHLHMLTGNVKENLDRYYPYAGHIQISQSPSRTEPFIAGGSIDYKYVFDFLKSKTHTDVIGLEYFPSGSTEASLSWVKPYL